MTAAGAIAAPAASAHAVLVSSTPVDGSRVNTEPAQVRLTFYEPVGLIAADEQVISAAGARADTGQVRLAEGGTTIVLALRPHLPRGTYSATWRVVSADTHVVSGSITFGLGVQPGAGVAAAPDHTGPLDVSADIADGLIYAGLVLLAGITAAAAEFILQGPRAVNASWASVFRLRDAGGTLASPFGQELAARMVVLLLIVPLLSGRWPGGQWPNGRAGRTADILRAAAGLALLVSVAVAGHEAAGPDVALALPAAVLHLASMAVWLGGLVVLGLAVLPALRRGTIADAGLRRWSITAYSCVICLVVTGEYQASRQISPVQALWSTRYGVFLLVKVALVAVMLAAALLAERHVMGAAVPGRTVTATLSSAQVAALRLTLRRLTADGSQWATSAAVVPLPGVWTLTLDVALGPADPYATSASYRVW